MTVPTPQSPKQTLDSAVTPTRSLLFYTVTATVPLIIVIAALLFLPLSLKALGFLSAVAAAVAIGAMGRLVHDMTLDIAGYPDFKLPIWAVGYLVVYLISAFAFGSFALHSLRPGRYFVGFHMTEPRAAFLDALYLSLCNYIGSSPDASIGLANRLTRYMSVSEGLIAMFVNVVIITKFVNAF
jgi:hypothetical protein